MKTVLVAYELDPNDEATGDVYPFCSRPCRAAFMREEWGDHAVGENPADWWDGDTVCHTCGEGMEL